MPQRRSLLLAAAFALAGAPASAMPDLDRLDAQAIGAPAGARVLPDEELAEMRGRFVQAGQIRFFGIQMYTAWEMRNGLVMTAGLEFGVDLPVPGGRGTAKLVGSYFHGCPECQDPSVEVSIPPIQDGGALQDVAAFERARNAGPPKPPPPALLPTGIGGVEAARGSVQSIAIGGDDNVVRNEMELSIASTEERGVVVGPSGPTGTPVALTQSKTTGFESGAVLGFVVRDNAIKLILQGPLGSGVVTQEVGGGAASRFAQHVRISGDVNRIRNALGVTFRLDGMDAPTRSSLTAALQSLQGVR